VAAKQFAAKVEERSKGQVKIAVYPANQLGSPPEQAEQVRLGSIDMSLPTQGALDKYVKAFSVVMLPSCTTATTMPTGPWTDRP